MGVRREKVILDLEDNFTAKVAKAAAAAKVLDSALDGLDGSATDASRSVARTRADVDRLSTSATRGAPAIDRYSGRMGILLKTAAILGPTIVPIGAALGAAGVAAGVAGLALFGLNDALTALNKYQLEPTAENLAELNRQMRLAGPEGEEFVRFIDSLGPGLRELQQVARAGFLPGLQEGIEALGTRFPEVRAIVDDLATGLGDLAARGGEWLAGPGFEMFQDFLAYAKRVGPDVADFLGSLASTTLSLAKAAAPVGEVVLPALTGLLRALGAIADSPIGTPLAGIVTAMSAASLATKAWTGALGALNPTLAATGATATSSGARIAAFGRSLGLAAVGFETFKLGTETLDQFNSWRDTADASASSVDELATVLQKSNVGRWADEFGIDLQRLAADMVANGESGEYVQEVFRSFGETTEGVGGKLNAYSDTLGFWTGDTEKATQASLDLQNALDGLFTKMSPEQAMESARGLAEWNAPFADSIVGALEDQAAAAEKGGKAAKEATPKQMALAAALREQREALRAAAEGFVDFGRKVKPAEFTLDGWLDKLRKQTEAMRDFRINAVQAASRGLEHGLIEQLRKMGPEGALQLKRLANASEEQIGRANRQWRSYQNETRKSGRTVEEMAGRAVTAFRSLPKDVKTDIRANGIPETEGQVNHLVEKYKLTEEERRALITLTDNASGRIQGVLGLLNQADGRTANTTITTTYVTRHVTNGVDTSHAGTPLRQSADGGTVPKTGRHYADRHPYLLADGEEVISNRYGQADRHRSLLKAINAGRLADGGTAGFNSALGGVSTHANTGPGFIGPFTRDAARGLKALRKELRESEKALQRERSQRDAVVDKMKSLGSDVAGGLTNELFGEVDPWSSNFASGSPGAVTAALEERRRNARAMVRAIKKLKNKGLKGAALGQVLSEGGLAGAQAFAELPAADLREYARLFNSANREVRAAATLAGNAAFGGQLRQERKDVAAALKEYRETNRRLERLEKALEREHKKDRDSDRRGKRNGTRNQNRGGKR